MSSFTSLVPVASGVLALATTAGMGLQWGALKALRDRRDDQNEEAEAQKRKIALLESDRTADRTKIAQLESDLDAVRRVVTGEVHWTVIETTLDHHHQDSVGHWAKQESELAANGETLRLILDELRKRGAP